MVNRPKRKGTAAESAVRDYARTLWWPDAKREPLNGAKDQGDVDLHPEVACEVKADKGLDFPRFLRETEAERFNKGARVGICVVKPQGVGDQRMHLWWMLMEGGTYDALELLAGQEKFMALFISAQEDQALGSRNRKFNPGRLLDLQRLNLAMLPGTTLRPGARRVSRTGHDMRFLYLRDGLELLHLAGFSDMKE